MGQSRQVEVFVEHVVADHFAEPGRFFFTCTLPEARFLLPAASQVRPDGRLAPCSLFFLEASVLRLTHLGHLLVFLEEVEEHGGQLLLMA